MAAPIVLLLLLGACAAEALASGGADMTRDDWYGRESLVAIRDWEDLLARRLEASGDDALTPVFPLPVGGTTVAWPNPIPALLLPPEDRGRHVDVRLASPQRMGIETTNGDGKADQVAKDLGEVVTGYHHPGGSGRDRWNHVFTRLFDRMSAFRPEPAPFAFRLQTPLDLGYGENALGVSLQNVTPAAIAVRVGIRFLSGRRTEGDAPDSGVEEIVQTFELAPQAGVDATLGLTLNQPGGGLAVVTLESLAGEETKRYWIPLLTHLEDTPAVLDGVEKALGDTPDAAAAARLASLRRDLAVLATQPAGALPSAGNPWRQFFYAASALRDEVLLQRITFDSLVFVKRKPFTSEQPYMDAHHCYNPPGGGIYRLSPVRPGGLVQTVVDDLGTGIYRDVCMHWDAQKLLFSFGNGQDRGRPGNEAPQQYSVYEIGLDGGGRRRLTSGPKNDCEPFYLPDGTIGLTSDRSEQYVMCGSNIHVANLHTMGADGSSVRQLSFNVFNDFNPSIMPDGRILYNRWEYNERSVTSLHGPFTMRPDGQMVVPYYGNASVRPNVVMFPRAVPGSTKIMALFTAHHGQTHGPIGLIDARRGVDGPDALTLLTPGVPMTGERIEDSRYGWYSDPYPLSEETYLCSFTPTVVPWHERTWALYVGDRHGNLALVHRDSAISCAEPRPVVATPAPLSHPEAGDDADTLSGEADVIMLSGHTGLKGVGPGVATFLRIIEDVPRKGVPEGGVIVTAGTSIYTVKRVLGTVPVEADGSAYFVVPANRNVYFELLDADFLEIQRMRSVVCLKPNEKRSCIGCHESRLSAPASALPLATRRSPDQPNPPPWGTDIVSYLRDVQPVFDAACIQCHAYDRIGNGVILTGDLTHQFAVSYEELLPYLSVANAMRWDNPDDVLPRPPYTYGSKVSQLTVLLRSGHHGVELTDEQWQRLATWIDANGPYYDRYEAVQPERYLFPDATRTELDEVVSRRCSSCHGRGDGRFGTWWLSLNWRDTENSRVLAAPLSQEAGGWQRCSEPVFADKSDPDYQRLAAALTQLRQHLVERPRADLMSVQGTPVERQSIVLPPPPPPGSGKRDEDNPAGIALSALAWSSATVGWTPNEDGLPRIDADVNGEPMRAGPRICARGIGTHAPSEITYRLDGRYARFVAMAFAAEENGTVVCQVYGDGKPLYDSGILRGLGSPRRVDVSVAGVKELRLVVTDAGDGYGCDMANWADARLVQPAESAP